MGAWHNDAANVLMCDGHVDHSKQLSYIEATEIARRRWNNDYQPHPEIWLSRF